MSSAAFPDEEAAAPKLDDQWQRQQKKTFTAWVNSHLRKRSTGIEEIATDLSDGRKLIALLEIISDESLPKPSKGNMKIHKVQNVNACLKFINDKGVDVRSIGAEEVVDHNLKMILGLTWMLILRFEIQDISEDQLSAKDALLLWCQRKTEPYDNVKVDNFHLSWKDGLAFCALIHRHRPELIDYKSLRKDQARQNFETAFSVAEKYLDIPPMLDIDDMVDCVKPDERSVMTQVAAYYKAFSSFNKAELAAKKIAAVLETNREHERLIQEYELMSTKLLEWILATIERLSQRPDLNTVPDCQSKLEDINSFRSNEIPEKLQEKGALEEHYATLQTKLRLSGRPRYVASEGKEIEDINHAWGDLERVDVEHKHWVLEELRRVRLAESKAQRFNTKATTHESWTNGQEEELAADDYSNTNLAGVQALQKKHEAFQSDLAAHEARVQEIGTLANELDELRYYDADAVNDRYATIYETWQKLVELTYQREAALKEAEERQQHLDSLYLEYAKQAPPLVNFAELAMEKLTEPYIVETEADVAQLQQEHADFTASIPEQEAAYAALGELYNGMAELGATSSPYSPHDYSDLQAAWQNMQTQVTARDAQLQEEVSRQADREAIRRRWAEAATNMDAFISSKSAEADSVTSAASYDKLEDQSAQLEALKATVEDNQGQFDELEAVNKEAQDNLIFENPHTELTIELLRGKWNALRSGLSRRYNELQNQIMARDATNITDEQLNEIRDSFNHFDKDKSGQLEHREFRACLISLGYPIPQIPEEGKDQEFERVLARVDPNRDGKVSFDEFIAFMTEENADAETADQLLEAFRALSNGSDYVLAANLERELSPELYEYCVQNMTPYEGGPEGALDYNSFATALYGESDL